MDLLKTAYFQHLLRTTDSLQLNWNTNNSKVPI